MIDFDYNKIYNHDYFNGQCYGIENWLKRTLKFGDNLAALCYAFYIPWDTLVENFPDVFNKNKHGDTLDHNYTIEDIIIFLDKNKCNRPRILEIGGGRGEISNVLTYLQIAHDSVEVCLDADIWYERTGKKYFGDSHIHKSPIIGPIEQLLKDNLIDLKKYDTIILSESVEHIPTPNFNYVLERIKKEFTGRFIVTNWKYYHPIIGSLDQPHRLAKGETIAEHVADINDEVYARWAGMAKKLIYKDGSHLILEF